MYPSTRIINVLRYRYRFEYLHISSYSRTIYPTSRSQNPISLSDLAVFGLLIKEEAVLGSCGNSISKWFGSYLLPHLARSDLRIY